SPSGSSLAERESCGAIGGLSGSAIGSVPPRRAGLAAHRSQNPVGQLGRDALEEAQRLDRARPVELRLVLLDCLDDALGQRAGRQRVLVLAPVGQVGALMVVQVGLEL